MPRSKTILHFQDGGFWFRPELYKRIMRQQAKYRVYPDDAWNFLPIGFLGRILGGVNDFLAIFIGHLMSFVVKNHGPTADQDVWHQFDHWERTTLQKKNAEEVWREPTVWRSGFYEQYPTNLRGRQSSCFILLQDWSGMPSKKKYQVRVSSKSVLQECQVRVSHTSVR